MLSEGLFRWFRRRLTCAVVTPVGPGHQELYRECEASVQHAWRANRGLFSDLRIIAVDDGRGALGRSRARNEGVRRAQAEGADWIFFLDADDVMLESAFGEVADLLDDYDAIWGLIASRALTAQEHHLRLPQILSIDRVEQLLVFDPFLTLQMGHFVRAEVAAATPFNEQLDAGEDFEYYLRIWRAYRCVKRPRTFFAARQGLRSSGPKGTTAEAWGETVRARLLEERERHGMDAHAITNTKNAAVSELQVFYRTHGLANAHNFLSLAQDMPFRGWQEISQYRGKPFVMLCDNDDEACLRLAWTGEYDDVSARVWQALSQRVQVIVDEDAGTGFYALLASRVVPSTTAIRCFVAPGNHKRLAENLGENRACNVEIVARTPESVLTQHAAAAGLVRLRVTTLATMAPSFAKLKPDLLIVPGEPAFAVEADAALRALGYRYYALDDVDYAVTLTGHLASETACWATCRDCREVEAILAEAGCPMRTPGLLSSRR